MKLIVTHVEELRSLGEFLLDEFQSLVSRISAGWNVQHNVDGTHGDITATGLTIANSETGVGTIGSSLKPNGNGTLDLGGQSMEPGLPFYAWRTLYLRTSIEWIGTAVNAIGQRLSSWTDSLDTSENRITNANVINTQTWTISALSSVLAIIGGNQLIGGALLKGSKFTNLWISGNMAADLGLFERSRTTRIGEWIAVAFAAGNFTATSGNWTLTSGDQIAFKYTLIGKTMVVSFKLDTTTVSATPVLLRITIPGGFTAASSVVVGNLVYQDAGGGFAGGGVISVTAGGTTIDLQKVYATSSWAVATDTTYVEGQITFEIQ